jgi:GNAT superfamily N-acetyltransferase
MISHNSAPQSGDRVGDVTRTEGPGTRRALRRSGPVASVSDVEVRRARPDDADAMAQTVMQGLATYRAFAPAGWEPPAVVADVGAIQEKLEDREVWKRVADDAGSVVAHVVFFDSALSQHAPAEPGLAHLWHLFVREPYWGTGLAGDLLGQATAAARERGFTAMRLATAELHVRARRFYEREGWHLAAGPFEAPDMGLALVEYRRVL